MQTIVHGFLFGLGFSVAAGAIAGLVGFVMLELLGRMLSRLRSQGRRIPVRSAEADDSPASSWS